MDDVGPTHGLFKWKTFNPSPLLRNLATSIPRAMMTMVATTDDQRPPENLFNLSMHENISPRMARSQIPPTAPWEHALKHNENNKRKKCAEISPKETAQIKQHTPLCLPLIGQHLETHRQRAPERTIWTKYKIMFGNVLTSSSWKGIQIHAKRAFNGGLRGVKYGVNIVIIWRAHISAQRSSPGLIHFSLRVIVPASSSFTPIVNPLSSSSLSSVLLLLLSSSVSIVPRRVESSSISTSTTSWLG